MQSLLPQKNAPCRIETYPTVRVRRSKPIITAREILRIFKAHQLFQMTDPAPLVATRAQSMATTARTLGDVLRLQIVAVRGNKGANGIIAESLDKDCHAVALSRPDATIVASHLVKQSWFGKHARPLERHRRRDRLASRAVEHIRPAHRNNAAIPFPAGTFNVAHKYSKGFSVERILTMSGRVDAAEIMQTIQTFMRPSATTTWYRRLLRCEAVAVLTAPVTVGDCLGTALRRAYVSTR
jgi:hypothetical protein